VAEVGPDDEDLFWALKGGGGNFGVITAVSLKLHPAPPRIVSGMAFIAAEDAEESLRGYRAAIVEA
jgi:FAD/FMN-containing dehydrogenase